MKGCFAHRIREKGDFMRKIVLYIAMSLDGFIADLAGNVDWLAGDGSQPGNEGSYPAFYQTVDTVILGYTTYHQIATQLSPEKWIYSDKKSYVITHRAIPSTDSITFTAQDPVALLEELRRGSGSDIWICGGASVVEPLLAAGLIDRYCVSVIPMILGEGIPLFRKQPTPRPLKLLSTRQYNGIVDLLYEARV